MLLFRAWWRRGEKERRGVEVVSSCIFLVLPPWKQMQWLSEVFGAGGDLLCRGAAWPHCPCSMEMWFGPLGGAEGAVAPPDWLLCLKLPEENSCCTVLMLSWEMLTWTPVAVVVQLVRRSLLWLLGDLGGGVGWAAGEQPLPSFLGSPGMDVGFQFAPLAWQFRARLQREQVKTDYKVPVEFFRFFF